MKDKAGPSSDDNVVPLGRGQFFAIDRRAWASVHKLGSMNCMVAYLVLARGTQGDMRTTAWSAESIANTTSIIWRKAKEAITMLVQAGIVRQTEGFKDRKRPRYHLTPAHEIPGCVPGAMLPALDAHESKLVEKLKAGRHVLVPETARRNGSSQEWWPISSRPLDLAIGLVEKGVLLRDGSNSFSVVPPADDKPHWIWLPNSIVDGADEETRPVELIRQTADLPTMRLFIDMYGAQNLSEIGGIHWQEVWKGFTREALAEHGSYVVWGFFPGGQLARHTSALVKPYMTGQFQETLKPDGTVARRDTGLNVFFKALENLEMTRLISFVEHLIDSNTNDGAVLHPIPTGENGEPIERDVSLAARKAGLAIGAANPGSRLAGITPELASAFPLAPVQKHIRDVQCVGLVRLRYRARTTATASWLATLGDHCAEWIGRYDKARTEVEISVQSLPENSSALFDINGKSKKDQ